MRRSAYRLGYEMCSSDWQRKDGCAWGLAMEDRVRYDPNKVHAFPASLTVRGYEQYRAGHYGIKAPVRCRCGDVGWFTRDVQRDHEDFGKLIRCGRCNPEWR